MTTLMSVPRRACLTTTPAVGVALMAFANAANAKGNHRHHNSQNNGVSPHFVISGQPASAKRDRKTKKEKLAEKKQKGCEKIIVPTAGCAISPHDPVGSVPPTFNSGAKGPSPAFTTVTLSNGVTKSAIFNGKGLTVTSNSPGTITVSNGNSSVTMPGGSLTLHGTSSVQVGPNMQIYRLPNGDVTVAFNPKPPTDPNRVPPGPTIADTLMAPGKVAGNAGNAFAAGSIAFPTAVGLGVTGGVLPGAPQGRPIELGKDIYKDFEQKAGELVEWVGGWF